MVISASRRTDIPCYYGEWFANRIKEGFLYVRNPMNPHQVSRINLSPDQVDCIVFWTKNPANIMEYLEAFQDYMYYFQFTLTGYGRDVEPNLPDKKKELIPAFQALSERIGKERVIWRYDPILVNGRYTMEYHLKAFEKIAASLAGYTEKAVISFVDFYGKTQRNMRKLAIRDITKDEMASLASGLARIASRYHLAMETCAEEIDLQSQGIRHGSCIDQELIERLLGYKLNGKKDRNQRKECGCMESVDVGAYHTCPSACLYCYANASVAGAVENFKQHSPCSPILCGSINKNDKITDRKVKSASRL